MATSNPFDKLNVKRDDDDDDQGEFEQVKGKEKSAPIGLEKKKKVRPKEKVEEGNDEGFEEVPNKIKKRRPADEDEEESKGGEHKKRRGINFNTAEEKDYRFKDKPTSGRKFDRQSGTGRGKEVSKGGAGGKGTWGDNPKNIAKDFEDNNDDYYFESALHPEKKKERPPRRPRREDKKEGEGEENNEGKKEGEGEGEKENRGRREKREPVKRELKEEEKLKKPDNAISLEDYLKTKEKPKEEEKEVKRVQPEGAGPLTKAEKKEDDTFGTSGPGKKKGKKKKQKELNKEELDLNAQIGANLEISGAGERERRPRRDFKKGKPKEFHYNEDDFPEL